ncbi:MAG: Ig-like domain-containing protein, partial [Candidatus Bathyarchaeia archaeon]
PEPHGYWTVSASWEGDFDYLPYQSPPVAFIVKGLSSITYSVSQPITIGEEITVSGTIEPARSGATVTLAYTQPDGTPVTREVITDASGNFSDTIPSDQHGNWTVTASWEGDLYYTGSQSPSTTFIVKGLTSITCSVSAETLWLGENIAVSGSIIPPRANVVVELRYTREDGSFVTRTATTDDSGAFRDAFEPDAIDSWNVSASWNGDPYFVGASSSTASFLVRSYWFEITVPRILLTIVIAAVFLFAIPFPYLRRKAKIKEEKRKAKKVKRKAKIRTKKKRK